MATATLGTNKVRVHALRPVAEGVLEVELRSESAVFAEIEPGAHIDLHLPNGLIRSYSLTNPGDTSGRYVVAVALDAASRGGSSYIHGLLRPGDELEISGPRNNFTLAGDGSPSALLAGGIGITPIWAMIQRLQEQGRDWSLLYSARSRRIAPYLDILLERHAGRVVLNIDEETGTVPDIADFLGRAPAQAHLYCCGPAPMLAAFAAATAAFAPARVHIERFKGAGEVAAGGFTVVTAHSGASYFVAEGTTILDTLLDAGLDIAHSCADGICGTCMTTVIEGTPDHRDGVLTPEEQAAGGKMLICVSGCKEIVSSSIFNARAFAAGFRMRRESGVPRNRRRAV